MLFQIVSKNYHLTLRSNPEELLSHVRRRGSLKSPKLGIICRKNVGR
jgi:hypothetical protein